MSKSEVKIYHGAIVCKEAKLRGDVTVGSMTVIHPCATIIAEAGPVIIGDGNIIEEQVTIINRLPENCESPEETPILRIGNNNVFEVGSIVESLSVGDNNVLESKSYIGPRVNLGNNCVIGAGCRLTIPEQLSDNTMIFGRNCARKITSDKPPNQYLQREFLAKVLPNYHLLKKSRQSASQGSRQTKEEEG